MQVDYILRWRTDLKYVQDCKVLPKEVVLMVCKVEVQIKGRQRQERFKRTHWWKLNEGTQVCEGNEKRVGAGGMIVGGDDYENEGRGKRGVGGDFRESGEERGDVVVEHRGAGSCG